MQPQQRSVPAAPSDSLAALRLFDQQIATEGPVYIRSLLRGGHWTSEVRSPNGGDPHAIRVPRCRHPFDLLMTAPKHVLVQSQDIRQMIQSGRFEVVTREQAEKELTPAARIEVQAAFAKVTGQRRSTAVNTALTNIDQLQVSPRMMHIVGGLSSGEMPIPVAIDELRAIGSEISAVEVNWALNQIQATPKNRPVVDWFREKGRVLGVQTQSPSGIGPVPDPENWNTATGENVKIDGVQSVRPSSPLGAAGISGLSLEQLQARAQSRPQPSIDMGEMGGVGDLGEFATDRPINLGPRTRSDALAAEMNLSGATITEGGSQLPPGDIGIDDELQLPDPDGALADQRKRR